MHNRLEPYNPGRSGGTGAGAGIGIGAGAAAHGTKGAHVKSAVPSHTTQLEMALMPVLSNCRVFFDFDNTLTKGDVLNEIIRKFSVGTHWKELEKSWVDGKIGAKECLDGQMRGIRVSKKKLEKFLEGVELDKSTYKLLSFLNAQGVKPVILSDNFTPIIGFILQHQGIKDVKFYANALRYYKDHLIPSFPYDNPFCPSCAHCKKIHLDRDEHDRKRIIYIGDGRSDFCPAGVSDIVFAKDSLLRHMQKINKPAIVYKDMDTVYSYFKEAADAGGK